MKYTRDQRARYMEGNYRSRTSSIQSDLSIMFMGDSEQSSAYYANLSTFCIVFVEVYSGIHERWIYFSSKYSNDKLRRKILGALAHLCDDIKRTPDES